MTERVMTVADAAAMERLGVRLARHLTTGDLVLLNGELGAGKTTLTRGIGEGLGIRGAVTSPTFVLARTHPRASGAPLVHVDAYRIADARELDDLDLDLDGAITVVEWAAGRLDGVVDSWLELDLERRPSGPPDTAEEDVDEPRTVTIRGVGPRWRLLPDLG